MSLFFSHLANCTSLFMENNPIIEVMGPNEELRKNGSFLQCWRSQPQKCNLDFHATSMTSKGLSENSKKMSWDNPVFPIDQRYTYRVLQTIQMKLILLWVRAERAVLGRAKTA